MNQQHTAKTMQNLSPRDEQPVSKALLGIKRLADCVCTHRMEQIWE